MEFFIFFSLIIFVIFLIYKYLTWNFKVFKNLGLPGPKPSIIFGNFPSIITGRQPVVYDVDEVYRTYKKTERAIGVFMTRNPEILLLDPKLAHELLTKNFSKFHDNLSNYYVLNKNYDKYAARNPFFSTGKVWKERRSDIVPGLAVSRLNAAYPIWKASALKLRNYLKEKTSNNKFTKIDTKDIAFRFTIDIIGDFLWGIDAAAFTYSNREENTLLQMSMKMLNQAAIAEGLYTNLNLVPFLKVLFPKSRVFPKETDTFFSELTKSAIEMRLKDAKQAERVDFLNHIMNLQMKKQISHDDIMGHMLTIVLDGYETAAIAIYHTLFYLAKYPNIQAKLRAELQNHLVSADNFLTFDELNDLPYLEQCIYETLRLISPLPKISRICTEPTELQVNEQLTLPIKPGMVLTIPVYSYHHDEEYFHKPETYNPDRFDNGRHNDLTKLGILLPFGDGPRICLGLRLALLQIKMALVEILKDYKLTCTPETVEEKRPDARTFIFGLEGNFSLYFHRIHEINK